MLPLVLVHPAVQQPESFAAQAAGENARQPHLGIAVLGEDDDPFQAAARAQAMQLVDQRLGLAVRGFGPPVRAGGELGEQGGLVVVDPAGHGRGSTEHVLLGLLRVRLVLPPERVGQPIGRSALSIGLAARATVSRCTPRMRTKAAGEENSVFLSEQADQVAGADGRTTRDPLPSPGVGGE